jgi:hypothetical protein
MGLTDNYTGKGSAPRPPKLHQVVLAELLTQLRNHCNTKYDILPEFCLDPDDLDSPAPDIIAYANEKSTHPLLFIEITGYNELEIIRQKCEEVMKNFPSVAECFIYCYDQPLWARLIKQSSRWEDGESYSTVMGTYLSPMLNRIKHI